MPRTPGRVLALCALLLAAAAAAASPVEDALAEAIGQYGRGQVQTARDSFEALSRQGVPAADYNLALMHLQGDLPGGAAEAARLMQRAAERGFVTAMFGLGALYEEGRLGARDLAQALTWYQRAAHAGSIDGMVAVGTAHYLGRGTAVDMAEAASWYRQAATRGDVGAQYLIASMYETGLGVEPDLRLARYWYEQAALNGDEAAPSKVEEIDKRIKGDCKAAPPTTPPSPSGAC